MIARWTTAVDVWRPPRAIGTTRTSAACPRMVGEWVGRAQLSKVGDNSPRSGTTLRVGERVGDNSPRSPGRGSNWNAAAPRTGDELDTCFKTHCDENADGISREGHFSFLKRTRVSRFPQQHGGGPARGQELPRRFPRSRSGKSWFFF